MSASRTSTQSTDDRSSTGNPSGRNPSGTVKMVNVWKSFRDGRDQILKGVNIDFPVGKLTYILGSSGAGKSVTLKHVLGILKPDAGEVWVGGKDMAQIGGEELKEHRKLFGMLFQNSALFDDMTVFENVAFPLREHTKCTDEEIEAQVTKALDMLGMAKSSHDKLPNEISGGMKKRVALARAIIREPSILLYDEPTTGLDPVTRTTVDDLIDTLKRELHLTSLVISHDIPSALLLADQIAFLHQGEIVFWGVPDEFREATHPAIRGFLEAEGRTVTALTKGKS
jgi:phospholipid/cholesterol/gamma-HCH transport system ATP-binding protein